MKKVLIIGLVVMLVLGLTAGMASATIFQTNTVNTNGVVTITQSGTADVVFGNSLRVGTGRLTFNQSINTTYGNFNNSVMLHGVDLRIENSASEGYVGAYWIDIPHTGKTNDVLVLEHYQVGFNQQIYMKESRWNYDAAKSTQSFTNIGGYIKQQVIACPRPDTYTPNVEPDTLDLWTADTYGQGGVLNNKFLPSEAGGRAMLQQVGQMHADYDFGKQWSNIGGVSSGSFVAYDNPNWLSFDQIIMYK